MQADTWNGNVFKVTSVSTAEEMVPSSNDWLIFPMDMAFDNLGNPVVMYPVFISQTAIEIHLAVFNNSQWKELSGDFTNHIPPGALETEDGLYFVYGDGTNTTNDLPKTLKIEYLTIQP